MPGILRAVLVCLTMTLPAGLWRASAAPARNVILLSDAWCPYNCDPQSALPGFAVEITRAALGLSGYSVEYRTTNWSRSVAETRAGRADAVIGMLAKEAPDFIFPQQPIGISSLGLATRSDSLFQYQSPASFDGYVLGVVANYGFGGACGDYIRLHAAERDRVQVIAGEDALEKNLRKLQAGHLDIVADDSNVLARALAQMGPNADLKMAATLTKKPVYIAFSPAIADAQVLAKVLDDGIVRLRRTGQLSIILARYHVQDWK